MRVNMVKKGIYFHAKNTMDLVRVRNAIMSFFGVYIGAALFSGGSPPQIIMVLAASVSSMFILGGGNTLNDYFDHKIDKINKPDRPIPSGRVSRSDAFIFSIVMFLLGLALAKSINKYCLWIAAFNTLVLIVYAKYGKQMIFFSNLSISYLVSSVFVYGAFSAYDPKLPISIDGMKLLLILTTCSFLINLGREVIKDIEDLEGDKRAYSNTLPIKYGPGASKRVALAATISAVIFSYAPVFLPSHGFNELVYVIVVTIANITLLKSFSAEPATTQKIMVIGMSTALLAFALGMIRQLIQAL